MSNDSEIIDEACPYCGEAVLEEQEDGNYWCPACGSAFDRDEIVDAVDVDADDPSGGAD